MWYTLIILLDVFLAWFLTSQIISFAEWTCGYVITRELVVSILKSYYVPSGFATLLSYAPNAGLIGIYYLFSLPASPWFCSLSIWEYMRTNHLKMKTYQMFPDGNSIKDRVLKEVTEYKHYTDEQIIYAVAPHGKFSENIAFGFTLNYKVFGQVTTVVTSLLFWVPLIREFASLAGCVPATSANISHLLDEGKSIVISPEGLRQVLHTGPLGTMMILRGIPGECDPRKGFIRLAVASKNKHRIKIVPVYTRGSDQLLYTTLDIPVLRWLQKKLLKVYYYPLPVICFGFYGSFWPKRVNTEISCCFGEPICVDTDGSVDDIHNTFCESMEKLINLSRNM